MVVEGFPVEPGMVMLFARSVGDSNRIYYDEKYAKTTEPGNVIAPPTYSQVASQYEHDSMRRPHPGRAWHGSGREPTGTGGQRADGRSSMAGAGTNLHAEQHFEYLRSVRAGEMLTIKTRPGKIWEREGRRVGKLTFSESITEYCDESGELVLVARGISVQTERIVEQ